MRWIGNLLLGCVVSLVACSTGDRVAGGTTETGNPRTAVAGRIVDGNWEGIAAANVRLLPSRFNPLVDTATFDDLTAATDSNGDFAIAVMNPGYYTLTAREPSGARARTLFSLYLDSAETLFVGGVQTQSPLRMTVVLTDTADCAGKSLYLAGTRSRAAIDTSSRSAVFDSVFAAEVNMALYDHSIQSTVGRIWFLPVQDTVAVSQDDFTSGGSSSSGTAVVF